MFDSWVMIRLISALSMVESGGNARAYNAHERAVGHLQIRQCVIDDVNRIRAGIGLPHFDIRDAYDPRKAEDICETYLRYWMRIKNLNTVEDAARIWNGGPDGWYKLSTLPYWHKVQRELEDQARSDRWCRPLDKRGILRANPLWQPQQTSPSPAALSAFTLDITEKSSSRSDLAITFTFDSNANAATENPSTSFHFTIKPSESPPAPLRASQPPTLAPVQIPGPGVVFEFHWNDTR